jgi:hypothetical protein
MKKVSWTDGVRDEEVLHRVKENMNKGYLICHSLFRNCLLEHVNEEKIEVRIKMTRRRETRRKQLVEDLKEMRRHWNLKEETLQRTSVENSLRKRTRTCCTTA